MNNILFSFPSECRQEDFEFTRNLTGAVHLVDIFVRLTPPKLSGKVRRGQDLLYFYPLQGQFGLYDKTVLTYGLYRQPGGSESISLLRLTGAVHLVARLFRHSSHKRAGKVR
jgi:hypothetical protein